MAFSNNCILKVLAMQSLLADQTWPIVARITQFALQHPAWQPVHFLCMRFADLN